MKNNWSKEEHILAFNLYCKIPFTKINATYAPIKELAALLGRSNNSVAMKLANFARLDPALKARNISGLTQGAKGEEIVWNEFHNNPEEFAFQSEEILSQYKNNTPEAGLPEIPAGVEGKERTAMVKQRVNQNFFRNMILASYNHRCCITNSNSTAFLTACHIKPWSIDTENRMNPRNGLCMNILFHNAFDLGLFTITEDYIIKLSPHILALKDPFIENMFREYNNKTIHLPQKFIPDTALLKYHNEMIFKK